MSIGPVALAMAAAAVLLPGGSWRWVLCGLGLFAGNFAFFLWHLRWDGLTFVIPSLIGLSLLAGIGAHKISSWSRELRAATALALAASIVWLYLANREVAVGERPRRVMSVEDAREIPERSILVATYWSATTYRYIVQVAAGRRDVAVVKMDSVTNNPSLIRRLVATGRPVFVNGGRVGKNKESDVPMALRKYQFWRASDE
jgi:hypothetical protein